MYFYGIDMIPCSQYVREFILCDLAVKLISRFGFKSGSTKSQRINNRAKENQDLLAF
jgi:hypothetical protein